MWVLKDSSSDKADDTKTMGQETSDTKETADTKDRRHQKATLCWNFTGGHCFFGERCHFAHSEGELVLREPQGKSQNSWGKGGGNALRWRPKDEEGGEKDNDLFDYPAEGGKTWWKGGSESERWADGDRQWQWKRRGTDEAAAQSAPVCAEDAKLLAGLWKGSRGDSYDVTGTPSTSFWRCIKKQSGVQKEYSITCDEKAGCMIWGSSKYYLMLSDLKMTTGFARWYPWADSRGPRAAPAFVWRRDIAGAAEAAAADAGNGKEAADNSAAATDAGGQQDAAWEVQAYWSKPSKFGWSCEGQGWQNDKQANYDEDAWWGKGSKGQGVRWVQKDDQKEAEHGKGSGKEEWDEDGYAEYRKGQGKGKWDDDERGDFRKGKGNGKWEEEAVPTSRALRAHLWRLTQEDIDESEGKGNSKGTAKAQPVQPGLQPIGSASEVQAALGSEAMIGEEEKGQGRPNGEEDLAALVLRNLQQSARNKAAEDHHQGRDTRRANNSEGPRNWDRRRAGNNSDWNQPTMEREIPPEDLEPPPPPEWETNLHRLLARQKQLRDENDKGGSSISEVLNSLGSTQPGTEAGTSSAQPGVPAAPRAGASVGGPSLAVMRRKIRDDRYQPSGASLREMRRTGAMDSDNSGPTARQTEQRGHTRSYEQQRAVPQQEGRSATLLWQLLPPALMAIAAWIIFNYK